MKKLFAPCLSFACLFFFLQQSQSQILITSPCGITENFDTTGVADNASLPKYWKASSAGTGNTSNYTTSTNLTATIKAASSGTPTTGSIYNWGNALNTNDRAIGFITSSGYANPNSIMSYYSNATGAQINGLTINFDIERYRQNTSGFSLNFFTSTDGITWTDRAAGDIATGIFVTGSNIYDFTASVYVTQTVTLTGINIPNGGNFYLRWVFNTGSTSSQGLGLDNVSLIPVLSSGYNPANVLLPLAVAGNAQATLSWQNPACYDEIMIVAAAGSNTGVPSGDGTNYVANKTYGDGTSLGNGYVVYKGAASPQYINSLTNGNAYYFKFFTRKGTAWSSGVEVQVTPLATLSNPTDYFRSAAAGPADWSDTATWQSSLDGNSGWIPSTLVPNSISSGIAIQNGHTVNVTSAVNLDQLTISGMLYLQNNNSTTFGSLAINDGAGDDINILSGGRLKVDCPSSSGKFYADLLMYSGSAKINVSSGGYITVGNASTIASGFSNLAITPANEVIWNDGAVFEWNAPIAFSSNGVTYFPNAAANVIPIFKISQNIPLPVGASASTTINGLLEVDGNLSFQNAGAKIIRNGIIGTATLTQFDASTGQILITGMATLGGSAAINLNTNGLSIASSSVTTMILDKTINNGPVMVNGILDAASYHISGSANAFTINGYLKTSNSNGFSGASNTTINNSISSVSLGSLSTIEYYATGNQNVSARNDYGNIVISNGGIKSLQGNVAIANTLALNSGALGIGSNTLTLAGDITGTGTLNGSSSSALIISNTGTVNPVLNFSPGFKIIKGLTLNTNAHATLGTSLDIVAGSTAGSITINAGSVLVTNDSLTLKSDANGTAKVGISSGIISGKTTIERYIQAHRAWRLLAAPVIPADAPTINAAWQEGQTFTSPSDALATSVINYGTEITNRINTDPAATGYDKAVTDNPSVYYLNGNAWATPANTNTVTVADHPGYMLFIRGDRSVVVKTPPFNEPTSTVLRVKGNLLIGDKTTNIISTGSQLIGNPYASAINFYSIYNNANNNPVTSTPTDSLNLFGNYYYVWDPLLTTTNGVGAFVAVTDDGSNTGNYNFTSVTPISPINPGRIESGEAFFIRSARTGNFVVREQDKSSGNAEVFRPVGNSSIQQLKASLYLKNVDGSMSLQDGALTLFSSRFSDSVNFLEDVPKLGNFSENFSILKNGKSLAIEKRQPVHIPDTVFYNLAQMKSADYRLAFSAVGLTNQNFSAMLVDKYTGTNTPISLDDTVLVDFSVDATVSSQATGRFQLVFFPSSALPIGYIDIKAEAGNNGVLVQWLNEDMQNVKQYIVEKSADALHFIPVDTVNVINNDVSYNWLDTNGQEENYYRICSINKNGVKQYSRVVKVSGNSFNAHITVYPNPAINKTTGLQFVNMPKGEYYIRLINEAGQVVLTKMAMVGKAYLYLPICINNNPAGIYELEIFNPEKIKTAYRIKL